MTLVNIRRFPTACASSLHAYMCYIFFAISGQYTVSHTIILAPFRNEGCYSLSPGYIVPYAGEFAHAKPNSKTAAEITSC